KLEGKHEADCLLCGEKLYIKDMRRYVGNHLLHNLREVEDRSLREGIEIGADPCGWCGLGGCKTQLTKKQVRNKLTAVIFSSCRYHYQKMVYSKAAVLTTTNNCSNVPMHCPTCPPGVNGQP
ncbi:hypothetical protein GALMADRAFT_70427, partial [Galerina marginata CBS 339.88]